MVLDPFRYSTRQRGGGDGWGWSLGLAQYRWLEQTLGQSRARFKFVFIHNLLSGDQASRGGVEIAAFNEWGGKNADGSEGFREHRPGWDLPVHQLLVRNHVAAVFKAHDNFYARQELDGIIYQMVPAAEFCRQRPHPRSGELWLQAGHISGQFRPRARHRFARQVTVEYVKASADKPLADSYVINYRHPNP